MEHRKFFDRHASSWDCGITRSDTESLEKILELAKIKKGEKILDVGCGTGVLLPYLRKLAGKKAKITALDFSSKMIKKARENHGDLFEYFVSDVHALPFENGVFDKVICFNAFPHFQDKPKAFLEIFRVLKSKGSFIVAHSASREHINNLHRRVGDVVKNDRLPPEKEVRAMFERAGFVEFRIVDKHDLYIASGTRA